MTRLLIVAATDVNRSQVEVLRDSCGSLSGRLGGSYDTEYAPEELARAKFARVRLYDDEGDVVGELVVEPQEEVWRVHDERSGGFSRDLHVDARYRICPSFETMSGALEEWLRSFGFFAGPS